MKDKRSNALLATVHPDLRRVIERAALTAEFVITEGIRTPERQKQLFDAGASKTMNSRHLTGHAVDVACLVNGKIEWSWPLYEKLAKVVLAAAAAEGIPIVWGGQWAKFKDGPHYELDRTVYP